MKRLGEIIHWLETQRDLAYALIRFYLGLVLFVRGWLFLYDPSVITELSGAQTVYWWYAYIISAHLLGGALLTLGFLTRFAALFQVPILAGAIIFIHLEDGLMTVGQSLELATLVLALLLVFALFGPGPLSIDHQVAARKAESTLAAAGD